MDGELEFTDLMLKQGEPYGLTLTNNKERINQIRNGLSKTQGYCPCVPKHLWDDDRLCNPCKSVRDGCDCHCGLYVRKDIFCADCGEIMDKNEPVLEDYLGKHMICPKCGSSFDV